MGYGEQIDLLRDIASAATSLRHAFNDHEPPYVLVKAVTNRLRDILDELSYYPEALVSRIPRAFRDEISDLAHPYVPSDVIGVPATRMVVTTVAPSWTTTPRVAESPGFAPEAEGEIEITLFLDTDDEGVIENISRTLSRVVDLLGYGPQQDPRVHRGSFFRRGRARAKNALRSEELQARLHKLERAIELAGLDLHQAEVDQRQARAVSDLITSLKDTPNACARVGSLLLVKTTTDAGEVIMARTLSQAEMSALDRFPEIQMHPHKALQSLAAAVDAAEDLTADSASGESG